MTAATIGQFAVKRSLTPKSRTRVVENDAYAAFARRVLAGFSRRVADGDIESLTTLLALVEELQGHIDIAVAGLRETGYSWAEIAARAGMTRQAAHQRWGNPER